jgi:hypothetical protein
MEYIRNAYVVLVAKTNWKINTGLQMRDNNKIDSKSGGIGKDLLDKVPMVQDRDQCRAAVNAVMKVMNC